MSAGASSTRKALFRKPSVRSLYDKQDLWTVPQECRSLKQVLIGYDPVSQGRLLRNPIKFVKNEVGLPLLSEHFLIRAIHNYSTDWESPFTRHVYETEATSVRFNMVYMHLWLLKFHLGRPLKDVDKPLESPSTTDTDSKVSECPIKLSFFAKPRKRTESKKVKMLQGNLEFLSDELIRKEHVRVYTDTFDDSIYAELRRQYRVIDHSLSAIFEHSLRALSGERRLVDRLDDDDLEDLILYNILNEEPEAKREQIKRISDYVRISVHEEDLNSFSQRVESYFFSANADSIFEPYLSENDKKRLADADAQRQQENATAAAADPPAETQAD